MILHHRGFPIRKSAGQRLFPPHRGLSQVIASFIGSQCQGIHLTLFFAWTAVLFSISLGNKFSFFAWASQIIVWVVNYKKAFCFLLIHVLLSAPAFLKCKMQNAKCKISSAGVDEIVTLLVRKNLLTKLVNFFTILITSFSQYTTICFVSFSLFGFQWACYFLWKER